MGRRAAKPTLRLFADRVPVLSTVALQTLNSVFNVPRRGKAMPGELDRKRELKIGPAANTIKRREQFAAETEGLICVRLTQREAGVHAVRRAKGPCCG